MRRRGDTVVKIDPAHRFAWDATGSEFAQSVVVDELTFEAIPFLLHPSSRQKVSSRRYKWWGLGWIGRVLQGLGGFRRSCRMDRRNRWRKPDTARRRQGIILTLVIRHASLFRYQGAYASHVQEEHQGCARWIMQGGKR